MCNWFLCQLVRWLVMCLLICGTMRGGGNCHLILVGIDCTVGRYHVEGGVFMVVSQASTSSQFANLSDMGHNIIQPMSTISFQYYSMTMLHPSLSG